MLRNLLRQMAALREELILNEVLSLNAQEFKSDHQHAGRRDSSMKS